MDPRESDGEGEDGGAKRKRARRPRRKKAASSAEGMDADVATTDGEDSPTEVNELPPRASGAGDAGDAGEAAEEGKGARRRRGSRGGRRRKRTGEEADASEADSSPDEDQESDERPKSGSPRRKASASRAGSDRLDGGADGGADGEAAEDRELADESTEEGADGAVRGRKKRRRRRSRRKSGDEAEDSEDPTRSSDTEADEPREDSRSARRDEADEDRDPPRKSRRSRSKKGGKNKGERTRDRDREDELVEIDIPRTQTIAVNAVEPEERRVAVFEGDRIVDFLMNAESQKTLVNDIYRGRVVNLEPAIGAAFIDFGQGRNGFLHTSDVMPIYGEDGFKLADLLTAGIHHVEGDHDAEWSEEADALDDDVSDEIADIDHLDEDDHLDDDHDDHDGDNEDTAATFDGAEDADSDGEDLDHGGDEPASSSRQDDDVRAADDPAAVETEFDDDDDDHGDDEDNEEFDDDSDDDLDWDDDDEDEEDDDDEEDEEEERVESDNSDRERVLRVRPQRPVSPYDAEASSDDASGAGDSPKPARKRRPRRKKVTAEADGGEAEPKRRSAKADSEADDQGKGEKPVRKRAARKKTTRSKSASVKDAGEVVSAEAQAEPSPAKKKSRSRKKARSSGDEAAAEAPAEDSERKSKATGRKKAAKKSGRKTRKKAESKSRSTASSRGRKGATSGRARRARPERRPQRERRPIDQLLKVGDPVVVQITKDAIGDKGPTLTTYISMPGRYLVLMPSMARTGVSRKIPDDKERKRLKRILASMDTPPDMGVIVRTAGVGRSKIDLQRDLDYLLGLWKSFGKKLESSRGPAPLYLESDVATRTLRDLFNRRTKEVLVDDLTVYDQMVTFAKALMPEHVERIKRHEGDRPLFQDCGIEQDFERIFSRRVELPSGGSIVFDQAEALVAIDVNSGRTRTDSYNFEEIALKTNLEAVPEIARQIRLRDLGGIIVCDFIDMMKSSSNKQVEKALRDELSPDRARSKLSRISQFGLLELTRQRLGPGTHKKVFQACPRCRGTGRIRTVESRAQAILRRLGGAVVQKGFSQVEVRAHPEVVAYLKEDLWDWVRAMEHRSEKRITLTGVEDQPEDSVLRYLRADGREVRPGGRRKR